MTARPRKIPYYARSLGALLRLVRPGSWLAAARRRPTAVSSSPGEGVLDSSNPAAAHIVNDDRTSLTALRVELTSLDAFVGQHPQLAPDVVKIDVEGHEAAVLLGMASTLADQRPVVIVELHSDRHFLSILEGSGYVLSVLEGPATPETAGPGSHVLAVPREGRAD